MKIKIDISIKVNRFIKMLVLSDLFFLGGWGLVNPIFSVFIVEKIEGATIATAGFIAGLYWLVKALVQVPMANYLDKTEGEKDDFYALFLSLILAGFAAFSFALAQKIWQVFLVQFTLAVAMGVYVPSWSGIFSRHLDEKRYALDWSLDSTVIALASFITSILGGIIASYFGFQAVFLLVGVFSLAGASLIFFTPEFFLPRARMSGEVPRDHSPANINK